MSEVENILYLLDRVSMEIDCHRELHHYTKKYFVIDATLFNQRELVSTLLEKDAKFVVDVRRNPVFLPPKYLHREIMFFMMQNQINYFSIYEHKIEQPSFKRFRLNASRFLSVNSSICIVRSGDEQSDDHYSLVINTLNRRKYVREIF